MAEGEICSVVQQNFLVLLSKRLRLYAALLIMVQSFFSPLGVSASSAIRKR
jgi:hypothetical protein